MSSSSGSIDLELNDAEQHNALHREETHQVALNLDRLEHLTKVLSTRSAAGAEEGLDEDDFNLGRVLRERVQRAEEAGIMNRTVGVLFQNLTVQGVDMGAKALATVGELLRSPFRIIQVLREAKYKKYRNIIEDFDGVIKAGEMVLVCQLIYFYLIVLQLTSRFFRFLDDQEQDVQLFFAYWREKSILLPMFLAKSRMTV